MGSKEYKKLSSTCTYLDFQKAKAKFIELYFDPSIMFRIIERPVNFSIDYKNIAISVGFKTQELLETSGYIPDEFDGFEVVKHVA